MWLKLKSGNYIDTATGTTLSVANVAPASDTPENHAVRVITGLANRGLPSVVEDGYPSAEDAQAALDELMIGEEAVVIQPPVIPEEQPEPVAVGKE